MIASLTAPAVRLRRARTVMVATARRRGAVRCSWSVALLAGFWLLL